MVLRICFCGPNEFFLHAWKKIWFYGTCALVFLLCILFEFYMFLSSGVWSLLTCGTIFGTVDFGAEIEDEEEEAKPEDAAPPGC